MEPREKFKYKKQNKHKQLKHSKPHSYKSTMSHVRGLPPSPHWSNKFTSIVIENNLLYLSNAYIVNINLIKKEFYQMINCNVIEENNLERLSVICKLNNEFILTVTSHCNFIILQATQNTSKLEDTRVYFREVKCFKFPEINNAQELLRDATGEKAGNQIKSIINIEDASILVLGDNQGNAHIIKYTFHKKEFLDLKYILGCNITGGSITDIIATPSDEQSKSSLPLLFSTSKGDILSFSLSFSDNYSFIKMSNNITSQFANNNKVIYSLDHLKCGENHLIAGIDKNGSLFLLSFTVKKFCLGFKSIIIEKNKFNDRMIQEKFIFFTVKLLFINEDNVKLIVSSNKGRIYYTNFITSALFTFDGTNREDTPKCTFKEITDNPHSMAIFNILPYNDKLICFSADNSISTFKSPELLFESDIKTVGSQPKCLFYKENGKSIFLFTETNQLLQYNYTKKLNGLTSSLRSNMMNNENLILAKQANFNEYVFSLLVLKLTNNTYSIVIYDSFSDLKVNKIELGENIIVDMLFSKSNRVYRDDLYADNGDLARMNVDDGSNKLTHKQESRLKAINEMFCNHKEYDLLYIIDSKGVIILWDFIYNKINKFKICSEPIQWCKSFLINHDVLLSLKISPTIKNKISLNACNNQLFSNEIYNFNYDYESTPEIICDYFISDSAGKDEAYLFFVQNTTEIKIIQIKNFMDNLKCYNDNLDYAEYTKSFNQLKGIKKEIKVCNFKNHVLTNMPIKQIKVNKKLKENKDNTVIQFMVSQSDNFIKIFELQLELDGKYKILLKYSIYAHYNKITNILWIDDANIASISNDHTLKLWNVQLCKLIDLVMAGAKEPIEGTIGNLKNNDELTLTYNSFNKVTSLSLYQQSFKNSDDFASTFKNFYDDLAKEEVEENLYQSRAEDMNVTDFLIFSLFKNSELNFIAGSKIINSEIKTIIELSSVINIVKFIPNLINLLLYVKLFDVTITDEEKLMKILEKKLNDIASNNHINNIPNSYSFDQIKEIVHNFSDLEYVKENWSSMINTRKYFEFIIQKDYSRAIEVLTSNNIHIEAIVVYKLARLTHPELFITILESLRTFIYQKHAFQSIKIQKVITTLQSYLKL